MYLGRPCPYGHDGLRYTKHGSCVACAAAQAASEEKKRYDLIYYGQNLDRILARSKRYHEKHRDLHIAQSRAWVKRNPERRRAISQAYNARRRQIEKGGDSTFAIFAWKQAAAKICYWCGAKCGRKYHVDHYNPLSKGGKHEVSNLVIACPTCNLRKSAKDPLEFAASIGRLF
ncbi:HNH endonuclease [Burkholderia sp. Bp9010]|nr:HNH endonuclease [Burkholderia sp. Bp9011]RQR97161.1 HNH endonuclease [Burkholderia sp. Bp9010]